MADTTHLKRLVLVRHGETEWNALEKLQGQTDIALNEVGREQARRLAARLSREAIDMIVSSDLQRAMETATIIAEPHVLTVRPEPRLRQSYRGEWEGKTLDEIKTLCGGTVTEAQLEFPPGGETPELFAGRLRVFWDAIRHDYPGQSVVAVAHGYVLRHLIALALDMDRSEAWRFETGNASISELHFSAKGAFLYSLNDHCHLDRVVYHRTDA